MIALYTLLVWLGHSLNALSKPLNRYGVGLKIWAHNRRLPYVLKNKNLSPH